MHRSTCQAPWRGRIAFARIYGRRPRGVAQGRFDSISAPVASRLGREGTVVSFADAGDRGYASVVALCGSQTTIVDVGLLAFNGTAPLPRPRKTRAGQDDDADNPTPTPTLLLE